jgi:hypothetical protein
LEYRVNTIISAYYAFAKYKAGNLTSSVIQYRLCFSAALFSTARLRSRAVSKAKPFHFGCWSKDQQRRTGQELLQKSDGINEILNTVVSPCLPTLAGSTINAGRYPENQRGLCTTIFAINAGKR